MISEAQARIQKEALEVLTRVIPPDAPVALLDFPLHHNAGDNLIWAGTVAYLGRLGHRIRYMATINRYKADDLRRLHPDGPILLQGGGNFGDRWPESQYFRERVIAEFPDRRIIQLPQSVEMTASTAARVGEAYSAHPALTVLVRDTRSMAQAGRLLPGVDVRFCPDLAFGYEPSRAPRPRRDIIQIKRTDSESAMNGPLLDEPDVGDMETTDWALRRLQHLQWHLEKAPGALVRRMPAAPRAVYRILIQPSYARIAGIQIRAAERTLGEGRLIVTDRLHAAILAAMMGVPVVALDNATGKIAAAYADYLCWFPMVVLAEDAREARRAADRYLSQS
jgi:pyruvyl transferase EpsO